MIDEELSHLSPNARLPSTWLVAVYLNALPSSFEVFKSGWVSRNDYVDGADAPKALAELKYATLKEEQLMLQSSNRTTALIAVRSSSSSSKDKSDIKCSHCHRLYHTDAECITKHPHLKAAHEKRMEKKRERRREFLDKRAQIQAGSSAAATPPTTLLAYHIKGAASRGSESLWDLGDLED